GFNSRPREGATTTTATLCECKHPEGDFANLPAVITKKARDKHKFSKSCDSLQKTHSLNVWANNGAMV
ncbi:MAG TPA: hypothetical protein VLM37_10465, partial [Fibrobacteraceae bacterium]|nr:hypothetical protein [Fibrobacteraceae bacterium]